MINGKFKKVKKEISIFFVVGVLTVTIDFIIYMILIKMDILGINYSKAIGFISGTIFSYLANRYWTFKFEGKILNLGVIIKFIILYSFSLLINVKLNEFVFLKTEILSLAFLFATAISATTNFTGMKLIVFKNQKK